MEGVEPPHPAVGPHQDDVNLHQAESRGFQHGGPRRSPERREVQEGSRHTTHTTRSHSREKSHVSHAKQDGNLQREIAGSDWSSDVCSSDLQKFYKLTQALPTDGANCKDAIL